MAGDEILPQETEGKNLPTSSTDRYRSPDEAQEQEQEPEPAERETESTDIESRRRDCADRRKKMLAEGQRTDIGSKIGKFDLRQRFYGAVRKGELDTVKLLLETDSSLLRTIFSAFEANALQVAVVAGQKEIFRELMKKVNDDGILTERDNNIFGETILTLAVAQGSIEIVEELVRTCVALVDIPNAAGELPVTVAALFGRKEIVTFLLGLSLKMYVEEEEHGVVTRHSFRLFKACMRSKIYDIALEVFKLFPMVCINEMAKEGGEAMNSLAQGSIKRLELPERCNFISRFHQSWAWSLETWGNSCMPCSGFAKSWYENNYEQPKRALLLFREICRHIWISENPYMMMQGVLTRPILTAAKHNNRDFIVAIFDLLPEAFWLTAHKLSDSTHTSSPPPPHLSKGLLQICMSIVKNLQTSFLVTMYTDGNGNTILHHAAMLSSAKTLSRFAGPSLQMQREIRWFKKAEKIASICKEVENKKNQTPLDLFTEEHRELKKAGEKWLKETASSCSLLATLIITVMFSAAFTPPGGYDNNTGSPVYLGSKYFTLFIISDALSLFFSCTSAMVFLGIYASLFREEDSLKRLPITLICGFFTLFISIITMVIAFSAALILTLSEHFVWIGLPVLMLASVPAIIYSVLHFHIFVNVLWSTLLNQ